MNLVKTKSKKHALVSMNHRSTRSWNVGRTKAFLLVLIGSLCTGLSHHAAYAKSAPVSSSLVVMGGSHQDPSSAVTRSSTVSALSATQLNEEDNARVARRLSVLWTQIGDAIDGEFANDELGKAVAMNDEGNRVVIGAPYHDGNGFNSGRVYVFEDAADGTGWVQFATFDGDIDSGHFGTSVAMNKPGNRIIVGTGNANLVRVFEQASDGSGWIQLWGDILGDEVSFGSRSVSMNGEGTRLIVGAHNNGDAGSNSGRVYIFDQSTDGQEGWILVKSITGEAADYLFGHSVDMNDAGDRIAVGAPGTNSVGKVHVYKRTADGSDWIQIFDAAGTNGAQLGFSLAMNNAGDRFVAGGPHYSGRGHARVFEEAADGLNWFQIGSDNNIISEFGGDWFGHSVDMNGPGDRVIVGGTYNDGSGGHNSGHARVYEQTVDGTGWTKIGSDVDGKGAGDLFGTSLGMNDVGNRIIVSSPLNDVNGPNSGHALIYQDTPPTSNPTPNPTSTPTSTPTGNPTSTPTTNPTFVPAATGSFEIHSTGEIKGVATAFNTIELLTSYNASNREHSTTVLSPNCVDPFTGSAATAFSITSSNDESLGNGFIAFNNTIEIDISKINGTEWFKPLPSGDYGGIIDLCLEAAVLLSLNGVDEKMNIINTNVTLTVEMDANFEGITIDLNRNDATEEDVSVNYSEYIEAYQCNGAAPDSPLGVPLPTYTQGDDLTICVRGTDDGVTDVSSIKSLVISQAGAGASPFTYVEDGSPVSIEIASVQCNQGNTDVCVADLKLLGRFFSVDEPGDLTVSGDVVLDFGGGSTTTRRLGTSLKMEKNGDKSVSGDVSSRRMQEEIEGFTLVDIKLGKSGDESSSFDYGALISTLLAGAIGSVLMLLFF